MSQQGERPAAADDWWSRLYDETAEDQKAAATGDSLDDRFDSVAGAVNGTVPAPGPEQVPGYGPVHDQEPEPEDAPPPVAAPWEPPVAGPHEPRTFPEREPEDASEGGPVPEGEPARGGGSLRDDRPGPGDAPRTVAAPPGRAPWESPEGEWQAPRAFPPGPPVQPVVDPVPEFLPLPPPPPAFPQQSTAAVPAPGDAPRPRAAVVHVGDGPPTYDAEPTALPDAHPDALDGLTADTVLDGAGYGSYTLRAASVRGDSARYRGEPRRDALLTARFGSGASALVLVAVAGGARGADTAHLAAADACRWIGGAVGRSRVRLVEDIRAGRRGDLKSGLHRLTGRGYGKLRARAAELGLEPDQYTASLRCLLLSGDPECRTRVFFGVGNGGLFRLRDGAWQDLEPPRPERSAVAGAAVVGFGSEPAETPEGDRLTMDLGITSASYTESPQPPSEPFRFRASVARPGDTLLLCSAGLADPLRGEPALADELAGRWGPAEPPGLAAFLADAQIRVKGYADDRTAAAVWEA